MQACHQVGQAGAGAVGEGTGEWTREGIGAVEGIGAAGGTQAQVHSCSIPHRTELWKAAMVDSIIRYHFHCILPGLTVHPTYPLLAWHQTVALGHWYQHSKNVDWSKAKESFVNRY